MPEKEYIEREAADKELCAFIHELNRACASAESNAVFEALARIRYLPAADVEPVRHGGWIWEEEAERYRCSSCRISYDYDKTYELFDHGFQFASFCPSCGAKMDRGDT